MEGFLKLSTAVNVTALMIDSTDHITGKTGLTLTIYETKAAGTPTSISPTVTELDSTNAKGLYKLALTTGHTDTLGELQLHITSTGADPCDIKWQVSTYLPGEAATLQAAQSVNVSTINSVSAAGVTTVNAVIGTIQNVNHTGTGNNALVKSDLVDIAGAAVSVSTAQLGVNAVQINAVSAASVTTVNAVVGTVQNINHTGTANSALVKADMVDVAGAAVSTSSAQIGVNLVNFGGSAPNALIAGRVDANAQVVGDKTGYSLSQTFPANFSSFALTAGGAVTVGTNNDKTGYSLVAGQLFIKKNTALAKFEFVMTDSTTHAPKTGVTVTATRSIDGAAFAATANAATEIANGWYQIDLANTDLNGTVISLRFTGTNADDKNLTIITQA